MHYLRNDLAYISIGQRMPTYSVFELLIEARGERLKIMTKSLVIGS